MGKDYTYICPHCKKEMDYVGQDQRCTVHYEYSFNTKEWDINEHDDCEFIEFYCPNCNEVLPTELEKEIWKQI